jgi:hypothetical protein
MVNLVEEAESNFALRGDSRVVIDGLVIEFKLMVFLKGSPHNEQFKPFHLTQRKGAFSGDFHGLGSGTKGIIAEKPAP